MKRGCFLSKPGCHIIYRHALLHHPAGDLLHCFCAEEISQYLVRDVDAEEDVDDVVTTNFFESVDKSPGRKRKSKDNKKRKSKKRKITSSSSGASPDNSSDDSDSSSESESDPWSETYANLCNRSMCSSPFNLFPFLDLVMGTFLTKHLINAD